MSVEFVHYYENRKDLTDISVMLDIGDYLEYN